MYSFLYIFGTYFNIYVKQGRQRNYRMPNYKILMNPSDFPSFAFNSIKLTSRYVYEFYSVLLYHKPGQYDDFNINY